MSSKTDTEVIIGGKVFTLSGYESEEYLQKVASYINNKVNEYSKVDSFRRQPLDTQSVLLQLNIADDYFKAKKQISILEEELQAKEKELYDLKHELISAQIKLENSEKQTKELNSKLNESERTIVRLETELKDK
jgi:cell division protein ZapA